MGDAEMELDRLEQIFGRDNTYVELQNGHLDIQQPVFQALPGLAAKRGLPLVATGDVHYLDADRRLSPRGAPLHPVGRLAEEPEPLEVRDERVLLQDAGGDGARLPGPRGRDASHARDRRPLQRRDRARPDPAPEVPDAGRPRLVRLPRRAVRGGAREALRQGDAGADRAAPVRAEDRARDGLRRLLPDRRRLHQLREARRRLGRPGPRQRRRLAGRLLPRHHRRRSDALRPPVRAIPQPGPQGHARHGHRLRGRGPGARDQLRRREVRARPRGADHHLLDDGGARRRA